MRCRHVLVGVRGRAPRPHDGARCRSWRSWAAWLASSAAISTVASAWTRVRAPPRTSAASSTPGRGRRRLVGSTARWRWPAERSGPSVEAPRRIAPEPARRSSTAGPAGLAVTAAVRPGTGVRRRGPNRGSAHVGRQGEGQPAACPSQVPRGVSSRPGPSTRSAWASASPCSSARRWRSVLRRCRPPHLGRPLHRQRLGQADEAPWQFRPRSPAKDGCPTPEARYHDHAAAGACRGGFDARRSGAVQVPAGRSTVEAGDVAASASGKLRPALLMTTSTVP